MNSEIKILKPEDINDSTIETYIEKLKKYEI